MEFEYEDAVYSARDGETVLDCLLRHGVDIEHSCRSGVCQSCVKVGQGDGVDPRAQQGLSAGQKRAGFLLTCQQKVNPGLKLRDGAFSSTVEATIEQVSMVSEQVALVHVATEAPFSFLAGQFVHVIRPEDRAFRAYSVASLPGQSKLELHVRVYPDGRLSPWINRAEGQRILIRGPFGGCTYFADEPAAPLILAGTGTGAAPLLGILRKALESRHQGPIRAVFGAASRASLYVASMLDDLLAHPDLSVGYSTLEEDQTPLAEQVRLLVEASRGADAAPWVYLCGDPGVVRKLKRDTYLAGVALDRILSDPFTPPAG